ncbi:MAG: DUF58 domain-containing protein [Streptosporangiales bacterium]
MAAEQPNVLSGGTEAVLRRLELTVTRRLDGLLQGEYRGLVPGHGTEYGETRAYQVGDDVRHIDWNVTARMREPFVRETIADRELEVWLCVDASASLDFGTTSCEKADLALAAAAAVAFLTQRVGNRIGALFAGPAGWRTVPPRTGRGHVMGVLRTMREQLGAPPGRTDVGAALHRTAMLARKRGLVMVISDFITDDDWVHELRRIATRHDVIAVEVIDPRELELPNVGVISVVDPETGDGREVNTGSRRIRNRYMRAADEQRAQIAAGILAAGADHLQLRTDRDWMRDLVSFIGKRRDRLSRVARAAR